MLNNKKILSLILIMLSLFIFSSCDDEDKNDDFEYTISKKVTSDKDLALQNYTSSYYDNDYETNYKYAGKISNNKALSDDSITEFIPREYFTNEGVYSYMDKDYGYYISTKSLDNNSYSSNVILFDLIYYMSNMDLDLAFRPLFSTEYRAIPLNEKYKHIKAIGDSKYDNVIIPTFNELNYNISNLEITTEFSNIYFTNTSDEEYNLNSDNGSFIVEIEAGILKHPVYYSFNMNANNTINDKIIPNYYLKNNGIYNDKSNISGFKKEFCYSFYNSSDLQISNYNRLIKDIKTKFINIEGEEVSLKTNRCNALPQILISLSSSTLVINVGTKINLNISFDILNEKNNYIDNVDIQTMCDEYYDGNLYVGQKHNVPTNCNNEIFKVEVEESNDYEISLIKDNSTYCDIHSPVLYELINNQYVELISIGETTFNLETDKTYIIEVYYNYKDIEEGNSYLILNKINESQI